MLLAHSSQETIADLPFLLDTQQESIFPGIPNPKRLQNKSLVTLSYVFLCLPGFFVLSMNNSYQLVADSAPSKVDFLNTVSGFIVQPNIPQELTAKVVL